MDSKLLLILENIDLCVCYLVKREIKGFKKLCKCKQNFVVIKLINFFRWVKYRPWIQNLFKLELVCYGKLPYKRNTI